MYESWNQLFDDIFTKPENALLKRQIGYQYENFKVWPEQKDIFNAFKFCPFYNIKCIIIGQDPYPQPYSANGLAFSSRLKDTPFSLKVIFKEINRTIENAELNSNNLEWWAEQGVLLLNTALTVKENDPVSHTAMWKLFTLAIIQYLVTREENIVWMLWGSHAKIYRNFIIRKNHLVLTSDHPASETKDTGSFIGNNHFIEANKFLDNRKIDWSTYKDKPFPSEWL